MAADPVLGLLPGRARHDVVAHRHPRGAPRRERAAGPSDRRWAMAALLGAVLLARHRCRLHPGHSFEVPEHFELGGRHYVLFSTNTTAGARYVPGDPLPQGGT